MINKDRVFFLIMRHVVIHPQFRQHLISGCELKMVKQITLFLEVMPVMSPKEVGI